MKGAQRDTLLIVSGCAPRRQVHCGEALSGRNQRRGSVPGQIEFEGTALAAALTLAEPSALRLPGLQKGSEKRRKEKQCLRFDGLLGLNLRSFLESEADGTMATRSGRTPKLAAGGDGQGGCGMRRPRRRSGNGREVASFRQGKKRYGADVGDGSSLREGHRDGSWRNLIGKFGDDENVEGAERKEGGLELAAEFFDGGTDGFKTIQRVVKKTVAGICRVTDLMAKEGHRGPPS
jgi:hypothetical protein